VSIIVNPGTEPVSGADYGHAKDNMAHLAVDVKAAGARWAKVLEVKYPDDGDGRFVFMIEVEDRWHHVTMPGIPLAEVRWMDEPDQNIWDYPRLYVDGSSWVWKYAINALLPEQFDGKEEGE
jgi:hypothetical protein